MNERSYNGSTVSRIITEKNMIMTRYHSYFTWLLLVGLWSCQKTEYVQPVPGQPLIGTWQYVERGYSPGSGYIIEAIPSKPVQTISFAAQRSVSTVNVTDNSFTAARTYRVDSTGNNSAKLVLFDDKRQELAYSPMRIQIKSDTLELVPSCVEGCHFLFVRLR